MSDHLPHPSSVSESIVIIDGHLFFKDDRVKQNCQHVVLYDCFIDDSHSFEKQILKHFNLFESLFKSTNLFWVAHDQLQQHHDTLHKSFLDRRCQRGSFVYKTLPYYLTLFTTFLRIFSLTAGQIWR